MEFRTVAIPSEARDGLALSFPGPAASGETLAFLSFASRGDMKFGDPACVANREGFLRGVGIEPADALGLALSHSRNLLFPSRGDDIAELARAAGGADGIVLRDPLLSATVTVADCMPIWLLDRGSGAFGLLHSGWRGTGILARAVEALVERYGSKPSSVAVILGPAIGACCYGVPEARAAEFSAEFGEAFVARRGDEWFIDLRAANLAIAEHAGVGYLLSLNACTSCDQRLGSYRRQGPAAFTRMLAVCGRPSSLPNLATRSPGPAPRKPDISSAGAFP